MPYKSNDSPLNGSEFIIFIKHFGFTMFCYLNLLNDNWRYIDVYKYYNTCKFRTGY